MQDPAKYTATHCNTRHTHHLGRIGRRGKDTMPRSKIYIYIYIYVYLTLICIYTCQRYIGLLHIDHLQRVVRRCGTHRNTQQHTATHHRTLLHAATRCNTLQHAATQCQTYKRVLHTDHLRRVGRRGEEACCQCACVCGRERGRRQVVT